MKKKIVAIFLVGMFLMTIMTPLALADINVEFIGSIGHYSSEKSKQVERSVKRGDNYIRNLFCEMTAEFDGPCTRVIAPGVGYHPFVFIKCEGHWEAQSIGLWGDDSVSGDNGGALLLVNHKGVIGLEPPRDEDGGWIGVSHCLFITGECY